MVNNIWREYKFAFTVLARNAQKLIPRKIKEYYSILNNTNTHIIDKIYTHSLAGFINYVKIYLLNKYSYQCTIPNCYVCPQI